MANKKIASTVSAPPTATPKKTASAIPKAPKAAPVATTTGSDGAGSNGSPKKRVMTAVPSAFVSAVEKSLPAELLEKLKTKGVKEVCEAFVKTLVSEVKEGKTVSFTNNFTFARRVRTARNYKNLQTGGAITKPAHYVMTMNVKPSLKKDFDSLLVADPPSTTTTTPAAVATA